MTATRRDHPTSLPHIDEHSASVQAPAVACWSAIVDVVPRAFSGRATGVVARALGCADTGVTAPRPIAAGSTFPGFRVSHAEPPRELALEGRHRFSRYSLVFRIDALGPARSRVRAETRAAFAPGAGRLYRGLVIGTGGHALVVRRLLADVKRRAERPLPRSSRKGARRRRSPDSRAAAEGKYSACAGLSRR